VNDVDMSYNQKEEYLYTNGRSHAKFFAKLILVISVCMMFLASIPYAAAVKISPQQLYTNAAIDFNNVYGVSISWIDLYAIDLVRYNGDFTKVNIKDINELATKFLDKSDNKDYNLKTIKEVGVELKLSSDAIEKAQEYKDKYNKIPEKLPFVSEFAFPSPKARTITSSFGMRKHPILGVMKMHWGIDLSDNNCENTPVVAYADGVVVSSSYNKAIGNYILLKHNIKNNTWYTKYLHLNTRLVKDGEKVKKGAQIAKLGGTGTESTGPHLHFEIHPNGIPTNPYSYLFVDINKSTNKTN
jgi:murein DD-endopeptidase MepM/ murein hydrolase activator NlpD